MFMLSTQLNNNDVIVSPSTADNNHPGNASFQRIVNLNKGHFKSSTDKTERVRIARTIVDSIHESRGHFVERVDVNGVEEWREVDPKTAVKMAIFALRGQPLPVQVSVKVEEVIDVTDENELEGIKSEEARVDVLSEENINSTSHTVSADTNHAKSITGSNNQSEAAPTQPEISKAQLIKLQSDQTNFSKYPVGCRVHYNHNSHATPAIPQPNNAKFVTSVCVGTVITVFMDLSSRSFVYEAVPLRNESTSELLRETDLAYATGAPVCVQFAEGETVYEGEITGCGVSSGKTRAYSVLIYTENTNAQIYDNVMGDVIRYRHGVKKESAGNQNVAVDVSESTQARRPTGSNVESDSKTSGGLAVTPCSAQTGIASKGQSNALLSQDEVSKPPATMITTPARKRSASPCASSITNDDYGAKGRLSAERPTKTQKGTDLRQIGALSAKRIAPHSSRSDACTNERLPIQINRAGFGSGNSDNNSRLAHPPPFDQTPPVPPSGPLVVEIPPWLGNSSAIRKELFNYIIGKDHGMATGYRHKAMMHSSNCYIKIKGPELKDQDEIMNVLIEPQYNDRRSDPAKARQMIEDCIVEFVGGDGGKGRLAYDMAARFERNRCIGSKYNAVFQYNPFGNSSHKACMTIVSLPFKTTTQPHGVNKEFHGAFLLCKQILGHVRRAAECRITLCGDEYGVSTQLCDPYILVCGEGPNNVDIAVEILLDHISKHQELCTCKFP